MTHRFPENKLNDEINHQQTYDRKNKIEGIVIIGHKFSFQ